MSIVLSLSKLVVTISIFLSSSSITLSNAAGTGIQWIQLSTKMPVTVSDMIATPIGNQIIITGGCSTGNYRSPVDGGFYCSKITNAAFAFIPATATFKTLSPMPRERYRHAAAVVNNKLYVLGGRDLYDNLVSPVDVWDPSTNQWTTPFTIPDAYLTSDNIAEAYKDVIYMAGGYSAVNYVALNRLVAWNVTSNTFSNKTSMSHARGDLGGAMVTTKSNKTMMYTLGGFTDLNEYCSPLATVERYDIAANVWYSVADMLKSRGDLGAALLNQRIYTVGGETKTPTYCTNNVREDASSASLTVNDVESYDPNNNYFISNPFSSSDSTPWIDENDLFQSLFRSWAAAWPGTNTLYVFGGQQAYNQTCDCYLSSNNVYGFVDTNALTKSSASYNKHGVFTLSCIASSLAFFLIYAW